VAGTQTDAHPAQCVIATANARRAHACVIVDTILLESYAPTN
jgi:hypothetical protein